MKPRLTGLLLPLLGLLIGLLVFGAQPRAHALPEYTTRTGESCATCHVSPAGGGPRTPRGALWLEQGRPDQVPELPADDAAAEEAASEEAASEEAAPAGAAGKERPQTVREALASSEPAQAGSSGGQALYEKLGCAGCHGVSGEGAAGPALDSPAAIKSAEQVIRHGLRGMAAYQAEALSDDDLASVLQFLQTLPGGEVKWPAGGSAPPRQVDSACGGASAQGTSNQSCGSN